MKYFAFSSTLFALKIQEPIIILQVQVLTKLWFDSYFLNKTQFKILQNQKNLIMK